MDPVVAALIVVLFADWIVVYLLGYKVGYYRGLNEGHATARKFQTEGE